LSTCLDDYSVFDVAGAREGPTSAPEPSFDEILSPATGPKPVQVPAFVPEMTEADADGMVIFDMPVSTASRRCNSNALWNDKLCSTVCGMFKFHGYEFSAADAVVDQEDKAPPPHCCCCPGGATCNQL
jgi:hypothetical protein